MATRSLSEIKFLSMRFADFRVWTEGDSYVSGSGGASFDAGLRGQGITLASTAVGGASMTDIRDRLIANKSTIRKCNLLVVWDGSHNGYVDAESYVDLLQEGLDAVGIDFIVIPAAIPYGATDSGQIAIRDEFEARWPGKVCDWRDYIPNTGGVIDQNRMLNYPTDSTHLNQTAYDEAAAGVAGMIP